ncbi:MAG: class I SAM-dependent methyltransferase [Planctomycetes bacterium]|nr:class I SAM-dependent methyltransferase [Planctomycetota bacterium]
MDIIIDKKLNRLRTIIERNRVAFTDVANIQQLQVGYDVRADNYSKESQSRQDKVHQTTSTDRFFLEELRGLISGKEIDYLDVGCADGRRTKRFYNELEEFCQIDRLNAIDYSREMVAQAQGILGHSNVAWGNITDLPFQAEFNVVTCMYGVIGHLPEDLIQQAFNNLSQALVDGGILCIDVLERDQKFLKQYRYNEVNSNHGKYVAYFVKVGGSPLTNGKDQRIVYTMRMFTPGEINAYAKNAGLRPVADKEIYPVERGVDEMEYALVLKKEC